MGRGNRQEGREEVRCGACVWGGRGSWVKLGGEVAGCN